MFLYSTGRGKGNKSQESKNVSLGLCLDQNRQ